MRLRNDCICPITYELMRDPVVASDGLTYEKNAIEKWLQGQLQRGGDIYTSPLTGAPLPQGNLLFPNVNLRNLIQDFIKEGGESLYCHDNQDTSRLVEVIFIIINIIIIIIITINYIDKTRESISIKMFRST